MSDATNQSGPVPIPPLRGRLGYVPPSSPAPTDLKLDANEGPAPASTIIESLRHIDPEALRRYPNAMAVEAELANRLGIDPGRVLLTNGGDEAIDRAIRAFVEPGRAVVQTAPTFVMIAASARLATAKLVSVPWETGAFPTDEVIAADPDPAVIAVVTPNNPTGAVATADDLRRISEAHPSALLLIDLAYTEFADEDLTGAALALPNAVIVRTFSKAWGLAGARLGYAAGGAEIVTALRAAGGPYTVSGPNLAVAAAALNAGAGDEAYLGAVRSEREQLRSVLAELGFDVPPSQGNFVYVRTDPDRAQWMRDALAGMGVAVRTFGGYPELAGVARITCPGYPDDFRRLESALRTGLNPEAILFDMDGVLADVSGSFRAAIVQTAAAFGVEVTKPDIAQLKALGNANNDWVVSHRLIEAGGVSASLAEVTAKFEELYQGTEEKPGLRAQETLLCDRGLIERLAARMPLAIVTGRPRADAERFLVEQDLAHLFQTVVAMEDGPLKPDAAPIRQAMRTLGVSRAWMIGDTPDDARSARAAGVLPIGVPAPGADGEDAESVLASAGCGRVIQRLDELEGILP